MKSCNWNYGNIKKFQSGLPDGFELTDSITRGTGSSRSAGKSGTAGGGNPKIGVSIAPMFCRIQPFHFLFRRDPQADGFVNQFEQQKCGRKNPKEAGADPEKLGADYFQRGPAEVYY